MPDSTRNVREFTVAGEGVRRVDTDRGYGDDGLDEWPIIWQDERVESLLVMWEDSSYSEIVWWNVSITFVKSPPLSTISASLHVTAMI